MRELTSHVDPLTKEELEPRVFREVTVKGIDASDYQTVQVGGFFLDNVSLKI